MSNLPLSSKETATIRQRVVLKSTTTRPPLVKRQNDEPKKAKSKSAPYIRPHIVRHSLSKRVSPAAKKKYTPKKLKKASPKKRLPRLIPPSIKVNLRTVNVTERRAAKPSVPTVDTRITIRRSAKPTTITSAPAVDTNVTVPASPEKPAVYVEPDHNITDPQLCAQYAKDIYRWWLELERRPIYSIGAEFMGHVLFIQPHHRSILVDWIFQIQPKFQLLNETMYLSVDILDRIIQVEPDMPKCMLQLAGITALFIASKFEEIYPPSVYDFACITNCFEIEHILEKEMEVVKKLDYQFNQPYAITFLRRFSVVMSVTTSVHNLAKYLLELSLLDHHCSTLLPSKMAAAALLLAAHILNPTKTPSGLWTENMQYHTKYQTDDFHAAKLRLKAAVRKGHSSPKMMAIRKKYIPSVLKDTSTSLALSRL